MEKPWGNYEVLAEKNDFKVKLLTISPNQSLSIQSHKQRSEHWIVIKGKASVERTLERVVCLDTVHSQLNPELGFPNNYIFIPQGCKHRLSNKTDEILQVIEIQTGSYFGEDDIERYEDDYGRV